MLAEPSTPCSCTVPVRSLVRLCLAQHVQTGATQPKGSSARSCCNEVSDSYISSATGLGLPGSPYCRRRPCDDTDVRTVSRPLCSQLLKLHGGQWGMTADLTVGVMLVRACFTSTSCFAQVNWYISRGAHDSRPDTTEASLHYTRRRDVPVSRSRLQLARPWVHWGCRRRTQLQALHPSSGTTWPSLLPKPTEVPAAGRAWS